MEASTEQPRRGEIGKQTYEKVQSLIASGKKPTEAFAAVAEQTGRSPGDGGHGVLPHGAFDAGRRRRQAAAAARHPHAGGGPGGAQQRRAGGTPRP